MLCDLVVCCDLVWQAVSSVVQSWVQGGLGNNLDKTFFSSSLAKSKVTTRGARMIPREQWLVKTRQPSEDKDSVSLLDHWSLPKRAATFLFDKEASWVWEKKRKASSLSMFSAYKRNSDSVYPFTPCNLGAVE